jgi:hypothetical protein
VAATTNPCRWNPCRSTVVSRGMTTPTGLRPVVLGLLAVLLLGACSGSTGGGAPGNPGSTDPTAPIGGNVNPTPVDPGFGQPKLVIPRPGQLNPRPVGAASLEPAVNGRHVLVKVTWWSGVEPCNVLDSVDVERSGTAITVQLIEGSGDAQAICIEIAEQKATIVDLGELEPGIYTISAGGKGDATPVTITVS